LTEEEQEKLNRLFDYSPDLKLEGLNNKSKTSDAVMAFSETQLCSNGSTLMLYLDIEGYRSFA